MEERLNRLVRNYLVLFVSAAAIVAIDQVSKAYVRSHLAMGQMWAPWDWILPYARVVRVSNTGVAFGMFQGIQPILAVLALAVAAAIIYYYPRIPAGDWILRLALTLQLGGALGNLVDRITIGHVTDFISIGTFAVFNVADSSITIGVLVLVLGVWLQDHQNKDSDAGTDTGPIAPKDSEIDGKTLHCE